MRRGVVELVWPDVAWLEAGTMRAWRPLRLSRERQRKEGPEGTLGGLVVGGSSWLLVDGGLLASVTVSEWVKWARVGLREEKGPWILVALSLSSLRKGSCEGWKDLLRAIVQALLAFKLSTGKQDGQ